MIKQWAQEKLKGKGIDRLNVVLDKPNGEEKSIFTIRLYGIYKDNTYTEIYYPIHDIKELEEFIDEVEMIDYLKNS